ncbi:Tubulin-tyrosine ligase/Tubulin polyglutamylase [Trinorchestia longiramus]|nr:Tubulin-tyrosine ligase/Tubulin polyglutamylase [Trinorchestia longiramus]
MEKLSMYRSDSPVKSSRKGEYKVQFADASEFCKGRSSTILGKPPEIPRSASSSLKSNARPYSSTSNSVGNLNTCYSNPISSSSSSKHHKGVGSSSTCRSDAFGSTTSLDRRRTSSSRRRQSERTLQPICDVSRSETLVEYKRQETPAGDAAPRNAASRRKRELFESSERKSKIRNPYASSQDGSHYRNSSGDRTRTNSQSKPQGNEGTSRKSSIDATSKTLVECNSGVSDRQDGDWMMRVKRAASRSPNRKSGGKCAGSSAARRDSEKENEKNSKERASRENSERRYRERGRSLKRQSTSGRMSSDQSNNNLEEVWSFEPGVMWSRTLSNRRIGYLLFSCSNLDTPPADSFPAKFSMTYKFSPQVESKLIRLVLEAHGFSEVNSSSSRFNLYWSNAHFNPNEIRTLQDWQKVNHFPRSSELTRKDRLYLNIKRMQRQFGVKLFDFIPTSFVLPTEYREFCDTHLRERGTWIVKPVASSQGKGIYLVSQGKGIYLVSQVDQVPPDESSLVSRYIESPLLVNGFKCDLRLYVAVTSLDPLLVYMFEEGLVRLATVKYQHKKNLWNPCIHLTNYSVNKFHSNYVHNQDAEVDDEGSKWSLSALLRHLRGRGIDTAALMRSVEDVVIKSLLAAAYQMNTAAVMFVPHARNCFELYGFDILIDEQLKPWVLEVNLSPSLNIDQPLDLKIKSSMLADLFSLAGILICNPNTSRVTSRPSMYRKLPNLRYSTESYERQSGRSAVPALSSEELRLLRQVMEEQQRRGGWARIFPTPDSWSSYGGLQEYDSPLNLMLHTHLYPHVQRNTRLRVVRCSSVSNSSSGLASSLERLTCYERPLPKGLAFIRDKLGIGKNRVEQQRNPQDVTEVKQSLMEALDNGLKLSKYQARMAFSVYLQHVQRRLMIGSDEENQTDLVYRFLRSASRTLHLPISVQSPSRNLPEEARAVVISKQLGDFIMAYTKETQTHYDPPSPSPCCSTEGQPTKDSSGTDQLSVAEEEEGTTSANTGAVNVTSVALPSHTQVKFESCSSVAIVTDSSDKSVRFVTTGTEGKMARFPSTSSFSDVTPSDVTDPLNPMLTRRQSSEPDDMASSVCSNTTALSDPDQADDHTATVPSFAPSLLVTSSEASSSYSGARGVLTYRSCSRVPLNSVCDYSSSPTRATYIPAHSGSAAACSALSLSNHANTFVTSSAKNDLSSSVNRSSLGSNALTHVSCENRSIPKEADVDVKVDSLHKIPESSFLPDAQVLTASDDLSASVMTASNDSFSSMTTSGVSGSILSVSLLSNSSLSNSFSSSSVPFIDSSPATSYAEESSNVSSQTACSVVEANIALDHSCKDNNNDEAQDFVHASPSIPTASLSVHKSAKMELTPASPSRKCSTSFSTAVKSFYRSFSSPQPKPVLKQPTSSASDNRRFSCTTTDSNARAVAAELASHAQSSNTDKFRSTKLPEPSTITTMASCVVPNSAGYSSCAKRDSCVASAARLRFIKTQSLDAALDDRHDGDSGIALSSSGSSWRAAEEDESEENQHSSAVASSKAVSQQGDVITMELYRAFMSAAKETDLEEVLALQTRLHNSAGMFLDSARRSVVASSNRAGGGGSNSRPRTPNASPHGSPRRGRKSPMHGSQSRLTEQTVPVTNEPLVSGCSLAVLPERASASPLLAAASTSCSSGAPNPTTPSTATAAKSSQSSSCCLFGNILKASLKGTNTTFNV